MVDFLLPVFHWEINPFLGYFLVIVAIWSVAGRVFPIFRGLKTFRNFEPLKGKYGQGSWAVITGASSPLGPELCSTLAANGYNLVLITRREAEIRPMASTLESKFSIQTRILPIDFAIHSSNLECFYKELCRQMDDLDVGILINLLNVSEDGLYAGETLELVTKTLDFNVWPIVVLGRWALVRMEKRKERSAIINVTSLTALYPYAGMALTSASMKFADFLLITLANEAKIDTNLREKVDFLSVRPSDFRTQSLQASRTSPSECVSGIFRNLGISPYTAGAWKHSFLTAFLSLFPEGTKESAMVKRFSPKPSLKPKTQ